MTSSKHNDNLDRFFGPGYVLDRRQFVAAASAAVAAAACGSGAETSEDEAPPPEAPDVATNPFQLGVASGDPTPEAVILWTRLAPEPLDGGGMDDVDVPVIWEVASDEAFDDIIAEGWEWARPELAHSVHADVSGLGSDRWFYYRFRVGEQWTSPVGRTRTAPEANASPERFRLALASCQNYTSGHYTAHAELAALDLDAVVFVGDYVYESGSSNGVREHAGPACITLEDYRRRHALYKSDENLRAAHRRFPWIVTWDDHEVRGNYAGTVHLRGDEDVLARRRAAYQAYYEHMPIRATFDVDAPEDLPIHRAFRWGDLAHLWVLDGRQYRTDQPCDGEIGDPCDGLDDPDATMLGASQKKWLKDGLAGSDTTWNVVAQQTVFSQADFGGGFVNPDQWDGYRAERRELLDFFDQNAIPNLTILTGDIHAAGFGTVHIDPDDQTSTRLGHEIVCTSISSPSFMGLEISGDVVTQILPTIDYFNMEKHGFCVLEYTRDSCTVDYRIVSTVEETEAEATTDARFVIPAGDGDYTRET